jgi:hypothetical protein
MLRQKIFIRKGHDRKIRKKLTAIAQCHTDHMAGFANTISGPQMSILLEIELRSLWACNMPFEGEVPLKIHSVPQLFVKDIDRLETKFRETMGSKRHAFTQCQER